MGVMPEYLDTYIAKVIRDHSSLDAYMDTILGVDGPRKARLIAKLTA